MGSTTHSKMTDFYFLPTQAQSAQAFTASFCCSSFYLPLALVNLFAICVGLSPRNDAQNNVASKSFLYDFISGNFGTVYGVTSSVPKLASRACGYAELDEEGSRPIDYTQFCLKNTRVLSSIIAQFHSSDRVRCAV